MMRRCWPPLHVLPVSPRLVCMSSCTLLHLFLSPQIIEFSIQDHGGSNGTLYTMLGNLPAEFKVIYSLHLSSEKY